MSQELMDKIVGLERCIKGNQEQYEELCQVLKLVETYKNRMVAEDQGDWVQCRAVTLFGFQRKAVIADLEKSIEENRKFALEYRRELHSLISNGA